MTNLAFEKITVDLAGIEMSALAISGEFSGVPFFEKVISIKKGSYMASVIILSCSEDITESLAGYSYALG